MLRLRYDYSSNSGDFCTQVGYDLWTGQQVAIRRIPTAIVSPISLQLIRHGTAIHALLDHPCIVKCYYCSEDANYITTVEEFVKDGSLLDYLDRRVAQGVPATLDEPTILSIAHQLLFALAYLLQKGVAHRDLKLDNVLYDVSTGRIKLADFGFAEFVQGPHSLLRTFPGTLPYAPPEVLRGRPYEAMPRDLWSVGVMLYALFTGVLPFGSSHSQETKDRIYSTQPNFDAPHFTSSKEAKHFLQRLLDKDPIKRLTLAEAMTHPWITGTTFVTPKSSKPVAVPRVAEHASDSPVPSTIESGAVALLS